MVRHFSPFFRHILFIKVKSLFCFKVNFGNFIVSMQACFFVYIFLNFYLDFPVLFSFSLSTNRGIICIST